MQTFLPDLFKAGFLSLTSLPGLELGLKLTEEKHPPEIRSLGQNIKVGGVSAQSPSKMYPRERTEGDTFQYYRMNQAGWTHDGILIYKIDLQEDDRARRQENASSKRGEILSRAG